MRKLILITGASAGIGAAFARAYAAKGYDLALTARRGDRLTSLARELEAAHSITALVIEADLALPGAVDSIVTQLAAAGRHADGLVNNAGYGLPGIYARTQWADQAAFIEVLATAPAELVHRLLPGMIERGYGRIINVASLAGILPGGPGHTLYSAVKAFMIRFSQSLWHECAGTGVHVTALCPGFTYSEFHDANGTREGVSKMPGWLWMAAEPVVQQAISAVDRNRPVKVTGAGSKFLVFLDWLLPSGVKNHLLRKTAANMRRME